MRTEISIHGLFIIGLFFLFLRPPPYPNFTPQSKEVDWQTEKLLLMLYLTYGVNFVHKVVKELQAN